MASKPVSNKTVVVLGLLFTFFGLIIKVQRNQAKLVGSGGTETEPLELRIRDLHKQIQEARRDYNKKYVSGYSTL